MYLTCPKLRNLVKRFGNVVWEREGGGRIWREIIRLRGRHQMLHSFPFTFTRAGQSTRTEELLLVYREKELVSTK